MLRFLALLVLVASMFVDISAAATLSCVPTAGFNNCLRMTYSGGNQSFTVPTGVTSLDVRLWGAAGGGANETFYLMQGGGAGGGFASGTLTVTPGQTLTLVVGQGGSRNSTVATFGGGGPGGGSTAAARVGGSGGGYSGIFNAATPALANAIIIAGGGGGASPGADAGAAGAGGGGGATGGQDALPIRSGRGGTQVAGGAAATGNSSCSVAPLAGIALTGRRGGSSNGASSNEGGGGGGGGYYGGGGGLCQNAAQQNGGGGGGSSFIAHSSVSSGVTTAGANFPYPGVACTGTANSGGSGNSLYTAGIGEGNCFGSGGNGEIVIQYRTAQITVSKTALGTGGSFTFNGDNGYGTDTIIVGSPGATVVGATKVTTAGIATRVTESIPPGWTLNNVTCSGLGAGGTYTPNLTTGQVDFNAAAMATSASIACSFTNFFPVPSLALDKTASTAGPVNAGQTITYTYRITNTGNVAVNSISIAEIFNGYGTDPVPLNEALVTDASPLGDSVNGTVNDGIWQSLGPGDVITFTAPYLVVQADIDNLQ